jgi:hypothetical protein
MCYIAYQGFITIIMEEIEKKFLANLGLGLMYLSFCLSEFLLSP